MKKYIIVISLIMMNCNSNPNYERNLATAQKLFELHGEEDLEGQIILVSKNIKSIPPLYGSKASGYDEYIEMLKGYHEAFDNIKYTADVWLPGTDDKGNLDGSVRTYGNWKGVNVATGKELDLNGYWYFNFDENGLVSEQGDFFDAGGMIDAVYDTNNKYEIRKSKQIQPTNSKEYQIIWSSENSIGFNNSYFLRPPNPQAFLDSNRRRS